MSVREHSCGCGQMNKISTISPCILKNSASKRCRQPTTQTPAAPHSTPEIGDTSSKVTSTFLRRRVTNVLKISCTLRRHHHRLHRLARIALTLLGTPVGQAVQTCRRIGPTGTAVRGAKCGLYPSTTASLALLATNASATKRTPVVAAATTTMVSLALLGGILTRCLTFLPALAFLIFREVGRNPSSLRSVSSSAALQLLIYTCLLCKSHLFFIPPLLYLDICMCVCVCIIYSYTSTSTARLCRPSFLGTGRDMDVLCGCISNINWYLQSTKLRVGICADTSADVDINTHCAIMPVHCTIRSASRTNRFLETTLAH